MLAAAAAEQIVQPVLLVVQAAAVEAHLLQTMRMLAPQTQVVLAVVARLVLQQAVREVLVL